MTPIGVHSARRLIRGREIRLESARARERSNRDPTLPTLFVQKLRAFAVEKAEEVSERDLRVNLAAIQRGSLFGTARAGKASEVWAAVPCSMARRRAR